MAVSKRVAERITSGLKRYQSTLADAQARDISESDTVVIIGDMLADVLGYRKYVDITTEFAIRGPYVDLAVKDGEEVRFLIEAKAIGETLKDSHVKQAIDYGANHGIEWVVLTNGAAWRVYRILFQKPIDKSIVFDLSVLKVSARDPLVIESFGNLSREGFTKSSMAALHQQKQITSKFSLGAMLLSPAMISSLRKELRRTFDGLRVEEDFLKTMLETEVLKREIVESDEAKQAAEMLKRAMRSATRVRAKEPSPATPQPLAPPVPATPVEPTGGAHVLGSPE